ncbi:hypothetical protein V5O48_011640 [Marasmius crinis-equi]|uniref:Uncharacterized protein n=1 Tax=Marasmius crinis-equi TaxID=585013 RepID=A0ABR3F516_9AGAR
MAYQQNAPINTNPNPRNQSGKRARSFNEEDLDVYGSPVAKVARWGASVQDEAQMSFVDFGLFGGELENLLRAEAVNPSCIPRLENPSSVRVEASSDPARPPNTQPRPVKESSMTTFSTRAPASKQLSSSSQLSLPITVTAAQKSTWLTDEQQRQLSRLELPGGSHFVDLRWMQGGKNPAMPPATAPKTNVVSPKSDPQPYAAPMAPTEMSSAAPAVARSLQQVSLNFAPPQALAFNTNSSGSGTSVSRPAAHPAASVVARGPRSVPHQAVPSIAITEFSGQTPSSTPLPSYTYPAAALAAGLPRAPAANSQIAAPLGHRDLYATSTPSFTSTAVASSYMAPHATSNSVIAGPGGVQASTTSSRSSCVSGFVAASTPALTFGASSSLSVAPNATVIDGAQAFPGISTITSTQPLASSSSPAPSSETKKRVRVQKVCDRCGRKVINLPQHQRTITCQTEAAKKGLS